MVQHNFKMFKDCKKRKHKIVSSTTADSISNSIKPISLRFKELSIRNMVTLAFSRSFEINSFIKHIKKINNYYLEREEVLYIKVLWISQICVITSENINLINEVSILLKELDTLALATCEPKEYYTRFNTVKTKVKKGKLICKIKNKTLGALHKEFTNPNNYIHF